MDKPSLWSRFIGWARGLFGRKPAKPGFFVSDKKMSWRGWLAVAPWVSPTREYMVYVPLGYGGWTRCALLVMVHGCQQTAEDFAAGTRITELADRLGCLLLLPKQTKKANPIGCWNWFDSATVRGWGETAIVAAQIKAVRSKYRVNKKRIFVAGLSSGGALAAVMGIRYPELFAGVAVHSGPACGAASGPMAAMAVLEKGADGDYEALAKQARKRAANGALPISLLVIQGGSDTRVAPINAIQLLRQYLILNGKTLPEDDLSPTLPPPDVAQESQMPPGRKTITRDYRIKGDKTVRYVFVPDLGHAWSGGDAKYSYFDAEGPDATALIGEMIASTKKR